MISGNQVILRAPVEDDFSILQEMRNDIELQTMLMSMPRPNTTDRVHEWICRRLSDERGLFFIIANIETNDCVGFIQIVDINLLHGTGRLGIAIHESSRGKGFGGEAIALCEEFARRTYRLRKVLLEVLSTNDAGRLYERAGYQTVGVHREHFFSNGTYHDVLVMEKLLNATEHVIREAA